ncbi:unnamed protein product [Merluccius merluccius]
MTDPELLVLTGTRTGGPAGISGGMRLRLRRYRRQRHPTPYGWSNPPGLEQVQPPGSEQQIQPPGLEQVQSPGLDQVQPRVQSRSNPRVQSRSNPQTLTALHYGVSGTPGGSSFSTGSGY